MAAPVFGSMGSQLTDVGATTTMNVDVPDSVAAGDIIVVIAWVGGAGAVTGLATDFAHAPDAPQNVDIGGGGFEHRIYVMWKRATAADSTAGTYNFTLSPATGRVARAFRYTGAVASGDPWDVTRSEEKGAVDSTTTPDVSDTTTVVDTLLVFAGSNGNGGTWTPATGFTEQGTLEFGLATIEDKTQAAAGATGSVVATCSASGRTGAWLGALKSVEPGGPELMPRAVIVVG